MGFLALFVGRHFRDEKAGRVVVFCGDRRNQGYLVASAADERKITAFLKMYYAAELSIQLVSTLVTIWWITALTSSPDTSIPRIAKSGAIFLGVYSLVVAAPYIFLRKAYKRELLAFVSGQEEVLVSAKPVGRQSRVALVVLAALVLLALLIFYLVQAK
jgi:hypothetical protein